MSQMMDSSTESPSKDTASTRSNGPIKRDEKTTTDGGMNGGFMQKLRMSFRRVTGKSPLSGDKGSKATPKSDTAANESVSAASPPPPSPSLSANSPTDSLKNIEKKEDDPNVSTLGQSIKRASKSFRQTLKIYPKKNKDVDMPISEDPEKDRVNPTFEEYLERQCFCEATQLLKERENSLFGEITEADEQAVEKLAADHEALEKPVLQTLEQSLSEDVNSEEVVSALMSAVKAIGLEEEQDQLWKQRCQTPPAWRPKKWKERHDSVLHELVNGRMDNPSIPAGDQVNQSSIQAHINPRGKQLKDDLLLVVTVVKSCYPPEMDICNFYAKLYHQNFSSRFRKIVDVVLDDKDCIFLLQWVNEFYPGILQEPELASNINKEALGKLLPDNLLNPLEEQYLSKQQSDLMTFIDRALETVKEEWDQGKEPKRDDGCYVSPVACDVIQFINGTVTSAQKIVGDQHKAQKIIPHLTDFMQRYKDFYEDIIKQNRQHSKAHVKANLGCVKQFRDFLTMESHLFPEDMRENCLQVLTEMKQSAHTYLLSPVRKVLKPHYQKLGTSDWLKKNALFEKLLFTIDEQLQELQGSNQSCHQELIGQFHEEVTEEYVQKLLRGEVKLKDSNQQQKAYATVKENAESLHELFTRMGSKREWLKEILLKIAEVLKLQDIPAIQMQIVSLGSAYPDLSEKHILALLKLKTNLTKADKKTIKTTVLDILNEGHADAETRTFFANVEVR